MLIQLLSLNREMANLDQYTVDYRTVPLDFDILTLFIIDVNNHQNYLLGFNSILNHSSCSNRLFRIIDFNHIILWFSSWKMQIPIEAINFIYANSSIVENFSLSSSSYHRNSCYKYIVLKFSNSKDSLLEEHYKNTIHIFHFS